MPPSNPKTNGASTPRHLGMRRAGPPDAHTPVRARILWPALGFPAVIAPRDRPGTSPFADGDATRCICVLVLSNRPALSKAEAARYLRYVPWSARGRRHIPAGQEGSFREEELAVRNHDRQSPLLFASPSNDLGDLVGFGGDNERRNRVVANLAKRVRAHYAKEGLVHLHEIRVYEAAGARLADGQYHLFWNNEVANEQAPSDEMAMLLRTFAAPRRARLGALWQKHRKHLMDEYEYEYGTSHAPYGSRRPEDGPRAEILHPLFVRRRPGATLRVNHITDIHVDVRQDVYEENLRRSGPALAREGITTPIRFNNWNRAFRDTYAHAKGPDVDALFLTGDLVDYGRGHWGIDRRRELDDDSLYHEDRNWFLFYHLLAAGDRYTCPTYTTLGNHDWRINPYPPFAMAGAPGANTMLHRTEGLSEAQRKAILRVAHGDKGEGPKVSYDRKAEGDFQIAWRNAGRLVSTYLRVAFGSEQRMQKRGFPTVTTVESVAWYLLAINPFFDYWFTRPSGHGILMLDWANQENVLFAHVEQGKRWARLTPNALRGAGGEGPKARDCLTNVQRALVREFTEAPGVAKLIAIHSPVIGPWDDWFDTELADGWKPADSPGGRRGYPRYERTTRDGKSQRGHPMFAIQPKRGLVPLAVEGMDASWNSFEQGRSELIRRLADPTTGVRVVLSGHIHRRGLFVVHPAPTTWGPTIAGELLIKGVTPADVRGVRRPLAARSVAAPGPLYVNTTSTGPRGHLYQAADLTGDVNPGYTHVELVNDGQIAGVDFRWVEPPKTEGIIPVPQAAAPARAPAPRRGGTPVPAGR